MIYLKNVQTAFLRLESTVKIFIFPIKSFSEDCRVNLKMLVVLRTIKPLKGIVLTEKEDTELFVITSVIESSQNNDINKASISSILKKWLTLL